MNELYSPLLGIRKELRAKSEYRYKIKRVGDKIWEERTPQMIANEEIHEKSIKEVDDEDTYNKKQWSEELFPLYRKMLDIFRNGYHLAEPERAIFYEKLVEYVEGWNRVMSGGTSAETIVRAGHTESDLMPFYKELEKRMMVLRLKIFK